MSKISVRDRIERVADDMDDLGHPFRELLGLAVADLRVVGLDEEGDGVWEVGPRLVLVLLELGVGRGARVLFLIVAPDAIYTDTEAAVPAGARRAGMMGQEGMLVNF